MKFYVLEIKGEVISAHTKLRDAHEEGKWHSDDYTIDAIDVEVSAETVRRLLGNLGGYAKNQIQIWPKTKDFY